MLTAFRVSRFWRAGLIFHTGPVLGTVFKKEHSCSTVTANHTWEFSTRRIELPSVICVSTFISRVRGDTMYYDVLT